MAKLKITIEPLAIVALFLFVCFGWVEQVLFYIVALTLHELAHYYVAKKLGYCLNNIKFSPFGAVLNGSHNFFKRKDEIIIALAGPMLNLMLAVVSVAIWWFFPNTYSVTYYFVLANFSLFICNMLPLFPLDCGRIVLVLIKDNKKFKQIYKLYRINSIIIGIIFLVFFTISAFYQLNLSFLFVSILLIMSTINIDKDMYYRYAFLEKKELTKGCVLSIKEYIVPTKVSKYELLKFIDENTFTIFAFVDKDGKIVKKIDENELLNILQLDN